MKCPYCQKRISTKNPVFKLERMIYIHRILARSFNAKPTQYIGRKEIAAPLEISTRSISRDIAFLRDRLGAPIENGRSKGFRYTRKWDMPKVGLDWEEEMRRATSDET